MRRRVERRRLPPPERGERDDLRRAQPPAGCVRDQINGPAVGVGGDPAPADERRDRRRQHRRVRQPPAVRPQAVQKDRRRVGRPLVRGDRPGGRGEQRGRRPVQLRRQCPPPREVRRPRRLDLVNSRSTRLRLHPRGRGETAPPPAAAVPNVLAIPDCRPHRPARAAPPARPFQKKREPSARRTHGPAGGSLPPHDPTRPRGTRRSPHRPPEPRPSGSCLSAAASRQRRSLTFAAPSLRASRTLRGSGTLRRASIPLRCGPGPSLTHRVLKASPQCW